MTPKISIVVPVYNMELYLERCLYSLVNQGLMDEDYEIILVNDGSKDHSLEICDNFAKLHKQVIVISQENRGLSATRNLGIANASGNYICFVDADDYLEINGLRNLLPYCDNKNDLIRFWPRIIHKSTKDEDTIADGRITFSGFAYQYMEIYGLETICWNCLYRKEWLLRNNITFKEGLIGEDFRFMFDVFMCNPFIISVAYRIYCYVIRDGSITTEKSINNSRKWTDHLLDTMTHIHDGIQPFKNNNPTVYERCSLSLEQKMPSFFAKVLKSNYTLSEYKYIIKKCSIIDLLPLKRLEGSKMMILCRWCINLLYYIPWLYIPSKFVYTNIFDKLIYPRIDRNKE